MKNDESPTQKTDTRDDSARDVRGIQIDYTEVIGIDITSHDYKKTRPETHKSKRARSRGLMRQNRTFGTNDSTQHHGKHELEEHDCRGINKLFDSVHRGIIADLYAAQALRFFDHLGYIAWLHPVFFEKMRSLNCSTKHDFVFE